MSLPNALQSIILRKQTYNILDAATYSFQILIKFQNDAYT